MPPSSGGVVTAAYVPGGKSDATVSIVRSMAAGLASSALGLVVVILENAPCISFVLFQRTADGAGGKAAGRARERGRRGGGKGGRRGQRGEGGG